METKLYYIKSIMVCLSMIGAIAISGCSDDEKSLYPSDSEVAFYNAAQPLRQELLAKNLHAPNVRAWILLNKMNLEEAHADRTITQPYFGVASGGQFYFPRKDISVSSIPWLGYMRIRPGEHNIAFFKTDSTFATSTPLHTAAYHRSTIYLTDSLGVYQTFRTEDDGQAKQLEVLIRMVHASPDLALVRMKVNGQWQSHDLAYRSSTPFVVFPVLTDEPGQPFRIDLYAAADTTQLIGRASISATPGHSYSVIVNGYYGPAKYNDEATGNETVIEPDFRLSVIRNR